MRKTAEEADDAAHRAFKNVICFSKYLQSLREQSDGIQAWLLDNRHQEDDLTEAYRSALSDLASKISKYEHDKPAAESMAANTAEEAKRAIAAYNAEWGAPPWNLPNLLCESRKTCSRSMFVCPLCHERAES